MKKLLFMFLLFAGLSMTSCNDDSDRKTGFCYCEFFAGEDQVYDLTHLSREEQVDACNTHDTNAANFGGSCELE